MAFILKSGVSENAVKQKSHLPVIVDSSYAAGLRPFVPPLAKGADGVMIETHNEPAKALCDGAQSLDLSQFDELMKQLRLQISIKNRKI